MSRSKHIILRCSPEEFRSFQAAARKRKLSVSDYIRWLHGLALVRPMGKS